MSGERRPNVLGGFRFDYRGQGVRVTNTIGELWRESEDRICWAAFVTIIGARSRGSLGPKKIGKIDPYSFRARDFFFF